MTTPSLTLISHHLCPYVQRVAIVLAEKGIPYDRHYVDLASKPDWFLACSPLGKTPVLLVDGQPIFESAVICEYLDDTLPPRLHPQDAFRRARDRAWMEFGSAVLNLIGNFYSAPDSEHLLAKASELAGKFVQVEAALGDGPFFSGARFCMVDAVFGPIFRYFDVFDQIDEFCVFDLTPKVRAWRAQLEQRASVRDAVHSDYPARLRQFLLARNSALSRRMALSMDNQMINQ
jgi:glutathione S-transferase